MSQRALLALLAVSESGRYDIWIGSFEAGGENSETLYVTELESNSP
jgi:hypothetical protein